MKFTRVGIALGILFLIGIVVLSIHLRQREQKIATKDVVDRGNYLTSLISLYPLADLDEDQRQFFLKTLAEYTSKEGFFYLLVHDRTGGLTLSLAPAGIEATIPPDIRTIALNTRGLIHAFYHYSEEKTKVCEFSKPFFNNGERGGVIRLGLKLAPAPLFSLERISLLAMITFFLFAALTIGYYGIAHALKYLHSIHKKFFPGDAGAGPAKDPLLKTSRISPLIEELENSLHQIKERLNGIETDNLALASRLGVTTYEKNKIIKILDSLDFGIVTTDTQDNIDHINKFTLTLLGRKRDEVVDRPLTEIVDHHGISAFVAEPEMMGQSRAFDQVHSVFANASAGDVFRLSASYLNGGNHEPIGKIITFHNITAQAMSDKTKHEFIAHVAHEILTPLTNIKSYSEMLMDGEVDDIEMQKEFYNTIEEQTERLSNLIKNLLNISKMEMGSLTLKKNLVRTDSLFNDCLSSIEASAKEKNITLVRHIPDAFPFLTADKDLLKAGIINILGNALKYTPENGAITFSITENDGSVFFDIIDTGYGISEQDLPRIFEKFYRSANTEITDQIGSGLGLALTAEIVSLHNGEIDVQSELGKGTRFTIKLPKEEHHLGVQAA